EPLTVVVRSKSTPFLAFRIVAETRTAPGGFEPPWVTRRKPVTAMTAVSSRIVRGSSGSTFASSFGCDVTAGGATLITRPDADNGSFAQFPNSTSVKTGAGRY